MGRSEHRREHDYSPVDDVKKRKRSGHSRSRSQTYSPSPTREVVSSKRRDYERGDAYERRRSRSRDYEPRRGGGGSGGGYGSFRGGSSSRRYYDGRDDPEPCPCLGVFGMSLHTSERDLKHLFGRYGEIESVQIVYDRFTGRSRGFGFVYFTSTKDAAKAKEHMMDAVIDGMKVRVDFSVTKGGGPYRHTRKNSRSPIRSRSRSHSR